MWPSLETTPKTITVAGNFVFITLSTLNRRDLHFEGAGNGPVVITWISRDHELYSGVSPISLVEHCITFRHNRRLLVFVHNSWYLYTTGQLVDGLQQKKKRKKTGFH